MKNCLNIGVIGLGRLGRVYAEGLAHHVPNACLKAVADLREGVSETFARENGIPRFYSSHQELIADKDIDAVAVITPTSTHLEVVIEAAENGKAIFCEKPISVSLEESREIERIIGETGVFFQMGFQRRFDRGYVEAKRKMEDGLIGYPVLLKSTSRDPFAPPMEFCDPDKSGGLIIDMGIHDFDVARMFMGDIDQVYSIGGALAYPEMKDIGDIDNAVIALTFTNGALGMVDLSRSGVYGYDISAEIMGTEGTLRIGYLRETPLTVMNKGGITHDVVPHFMERFGDAYLAQIKDFVNNVIQGKEPSITASDGIAALVVSIAATRSFRENIPVRIEEIS